MKKGFIKKPTQWVDILWAQLISIPNRYFVTIGQASREFELLTSVANLQGISFKNSDLNTIKISYTNLMYPSPGVVPRDMRRWTKNKLEKTSSCVDWRWDSPQWYWYWDRHLSSIHLMYSTFMTLTVRVREQKLSKHETWESDSVTWNLCTISFDDGVP